MDATNDITVSFHSRDNLNSQHCVRKLYLRTSTWCKDEILFVMACKRNLSFCTPVTKGQQPASSPLSLNDLMKRLISGQSALSRQLEGLMERQAAHTALLEETIQCLEALKRKFDEERSREEPGHVHRRVKRARNVGIAVS